MQDLLNQIGVVIGGYIPRLLAALLILIVGWIIARLLAGLTRRLLQRTDLDNRIVRFVRGEGAQELEIENWVSQGVFYLLMIFVVIAVFQALQLTIVTGPLNELLARITGYIPQLIGAAILLLIAWVIATGLKMIIVRAAGASRLEERLGEQVGLEGEERIPLSQTLGEAAYWLVFLLFLPLILDALELGGLLQPVQGMVDEILNFLPNLLAAAVILLVGWFVARIVQRVVSNLLAALGVDSFAERVALTGILGQQRLSDVLGLIVYVLIFIPVIVASLNALGLDAITQPASNMLNVILEAIPALFAAALLLLIAYIVARLVAGLVENLLSGIGFDNIAVRLGLRREIVSGQQTPSQIVGYLVQIAIMLFAAIEAARLLGFLNLAALITQFTVFAGQIILGLIILAVGLFLANLAGNTIAGSDLSQANLLALLARAAILVLAGAMALRQMGLANEIVNLAFGLLLGAVAVAAALAFGLGGRDIAGRELEKWVEAVREEPDVPGPGAPNPPNPPTL